MPPRNTRRLSAKVSRSVPSPSGGNNIGSGNNDRHDPPFLVHLSALPPLRAASGGSRTPEVPRGVLLGDGDEHTHGHAEPPKRNEEGTAREDMMFDREEEVEDEEGECSTDSLSTSSSAYMRHHRYEDPYTAYQPVSDPYDRQREIERQQRFISDSKRLGRPFIPSGGRALEKPTRFMLGDCVAALYRTIARDWPETDPMVISTAEDLIVVYIKRERVRNTTTVMRYMNASLKRSEAVRAFDLRKVNEGWDILTDDGHIMYTFKPPWVRQRRFLPDQVVARKAH
ncbi:hypothetical protein DQ04_00681170 [Trypanosoma grayi]|uniref:hypothetical protein n=1 Tax=Trypanosoma grayi TaxID=71804 RepID=UPI0004F41EE4|nr:hypothetical protein DQ04_00681170 [Trypanosoma grayi]KEG13993.1 hypothetical protein DQ04_00681170 [Trypanosoma grayi]